MGIWNLQRSMYVGSACAPPATAAAYVFNATVVPQRRHALPDVVA